MRVETGARIIAHLDDRDAIEGRRPERTAADWYGMTWTGCTVDQVLEGTERSLKFSGGVLELLHIPGHTPGSMAVVLERGGQRILFGQDVHGPLDIAFGSDRNQYRDSLLRLIALQADVLCEGHAGVIRGRESVRRFIEGYL